MGTESDDCTARHRGEPGATQQIVAVLLHAEVDRLAPLVVLVVVVAARVEEDVAAERPHVAERRRRDLRDGMDERGMEAAGLPVALDLRERNGRADREAVRAGAQPGEARNAREADHRLRGLLAALHVRVEIRAARDERGVLALPRLDAQGLLHARRREVAEPGESHHGANSGEPVIPRPIGPRDPFRSRSRTKKGIPRRSAPRDDKTTCAPRDDETASAPRHDRDRFTALLPPTSPARPRLCRRRPPRACARGSARGTEPSGSAPGRRERACPAPSPSAPCGPSPA